MRASRLLAALMLLQVRGRMSAHELADELEVSVRTVYRDMAALQAAGVPLYADSGPGGGYRLVDGYRTRLTGLTHGEARALFLTGLPGPAAELGLGALTSAAELKLTAALPPQLRESARLARERFHLDAPMWYADGDGSPHLAAVADAVWRQCRIRVRYRRWKEPTDVTRVLEPLGLVLKAGTWYVVARSRGDQEPRTYRVGRILDLAMLSERFDRPAAFDLAAHWRAYLAEFRERLYQGRAVVRLSPNAMDRLCNRMEAEVRAAVVGSCSLPDDSGWITATVPIESLAHAEGEFLRLGAEIEVLGPAPLRDRIAATARALAVLYSKLGH